MAKILVVDDEENWRLLYQEELTADGYEVLLAKDSEEALEKVKESSPDLVILDIRMPRKDGLIGIQEILGYNRNIPIILCSAYGGYKDDFTSWLADAFVIKSTDLTELRQVIRQLLVKKEKIK